MDLRLSVVAPGAAPAADPVTGVTDVLVSAAAGTPVSAVADQLRAAAGADGPLYVAGRPLADDAALGEPPLVTGATVTVGSPGRADTLRGLLQLRVVGGPDAGRVHYLEPGVTRIGRAAGCQVRLEDPDVSRVHAELVVTWDGVTVRDLRSTNGTTRDDQPVGLEPEALAVGSRLRVGSSTLLLTQPTLLPAAVRPDGVGQVEVNRPPRIPPPRPDVEITLPAEPRERDRLRFPLIALLLPLVAAGVMALFLDPRFLLFALLSPVMLLGQWLSDRSNRSREAKQARQDYVQRSTAALTRVAEACAAERAQRLLEAPDPAELLVTVLGPSPRLWERRPADDDALLLRLGLADLPARLTVAEAGRDAALPPRPPEVLPSVPVTVPLTEVGALGVGGPRHRVLGVARSIVAQVAALHSPRDVGLVVLTACDGAGEWAFTRWLPHALPAHGQDCRVLLGADPDQVAARVAELVAQLEARQEALGGRPLRWTGHRFVVVLDGSRELRAVPGVARLLAEGPAVGIHALCLAEDGVSLPAECGARAVVTGDVATTLHVEVRGQAPLDGVLLDAVPASWAERVARALAPLRDATPEEGDGGLPASARLVDLLAGHPEAAPPTTDEVAARWAARRRATTALLGVAADGPFTVDLRRDGPHGLVAGTTGSGKSELLQTLVASLALTNRPDEMVFVLVDYKGGAAFAECARLPHTVGLVTDLDGHLTERALASLDAELKRREQLLRAAGAKDVEDFQADPPPGAPALPRLVIVIDEFATLVEELPDFVRGLVGVAQRGRSLGVHLVLATQRPAGVVSADIRANTNLRIALRVTDESESRDVIDARDAATITRRTPGRAYARRGAEPLVAFQTARVGGRPPAAGRAGATVEVLPWSALGAPPPRPSRGERAEGPTDLAAIVEAVRAAAERLDLPPLSRPWLPPLPELVPAAALPMAAHPVRDGGAAAPNPAPLPYGLADLPAAQDQRPVALDLAHGGHLMVVGAPRSGRSTLLRTLAAQVAAHCSPADVHLYGLDCGNGALLALADLPHCGAVVSAEQPDRVDRLLRRLAEECRRRQAVLGRDGFADVAEQRAYAPPDQRLPYLLLLLDRWEGFMSTLDEVDGGRLTEAVQRLLREGPAAGLRVVLTSDRSGLVGRVSSLVEHKLVLRLGDRADFGLAGLSARQVPERLPPGRALRAEDGVEVQLALPGEDPSGPGQLAFLRALAEQVRGAACDLDPARLPFRVDELPARIGYAQALAAGAPPSLVPGGPVTALVGVGGDELAPQWVDLAAEGPGFVVGGPPRSGRSTTLLTIATSLLERGCPVVLVTPRPSVLRSLAGEPGVEALLTGSATDLAVLEARAAQDARLAVIVDDGELLVDSALAPGLEAFLRSARDRDRALVVGGTTSELQAGFRGYVVDARKSRTGLVLSPESPLDGDLLGTRLPRSLVTAGPPGRAALVVRGALLPVQVPHVGEGEPARS